MLGTDEFLQQPIWNNLYFTSNGKPVVFHRWIRSNILIVKDLYNEDGNFKCIEDFSEILVDKSNHLCEYIVLKKIFSPLSQKFNCKKGKYVNIKSRHHFLFTNRLEDARLKKSKFYYNIFVKQNVISLAIRATFQGL